MATDVNTLTKKRKSTDFYLNLGVDETDCSPSNSPTLHCKDGILLSETEETRNLPEETKVSDFKKLKTDDSHKDMETDKLTSALPNSKPFLTLTFHENEFANNYKKQIISYLKCLVNFEFREESFGETETTVHLWECTDLGNQPVVEQKNDELFVVDTTPSKCRESLPKYSPNSSNIIEDIESNKKEDDSLMCRPKLVCFNCEGNHSIRDCTEIKNYRRINIARNKYMSTSQTKSVRYHLEDEQKYSHLVPGKISENLRRALDVRKNEIPPYIYRMRKFGYPPGWLEEGMNTTSKLELFDFQGCAVQNGNENKCIIDPSKVVGYPGFNMPLEKGWKDDYMYYNCPPYNDDLSKEAMLKFLGIQFLKESQNLESHCEPSNQEQQPTVVETPLKCEESDSSSKESECTDQSQRPTSPSLKDLELKKRQLLAELEEGSMSSPLPNMIEINENSITDTSVTSNCNVIESPSVVATAFGTPILKTASPYSDLPDRDKWSKDISQVINFENLPDSLGKYEQMNKVIIKIRNERNNTS